MSTPIDYGRAIRIMRAARDMTQTDVAARAGLHGSYLSVLEAGKREATQATLTAIADALGVPLWLLTALGTDPAEVDRATAERLGPVFLGAFGKRG